MNDSPQNPVPEEEMSDVELIGRLRDVAIPETLEAKLLSVNSGEKKVGKEIRSKEYGRSIKTVVTWIVAASVLVGGLVATWYVLNQQRDNGGLADNDTHKTGNTGETKNGVGESTNDQKTQPIEMAKKTLEEIDRLERMVASQWKPSTDYSVTSANWRHTSSSSGFDSLPVMSQVSVGGDENDIASILYHSARLSEQRGSDDQSVRSEYQLVIDQYPDSIYASMSQREIERRQ